MRVRLASLAATLAPLLLWLFFFARAVSGATGLALALRVMFWGMMGVFALILGFHVARASRNWFRPVRAVAVDGYVVGVGEAGIFATAWTAGVARFPVDAPIPLGDKTVVAAGERTAVVCAYYSLFRAPTEKAVEAARALEALGFEVPKEYRSPFLNVYVRASRAQEPHACGGLGTLVVERSWRGWRASWYPRSGRKRLALGLSTHYPIEVREVRRLASRVLSFARVSPPERGVLIGWGESGRELRVPRTHIGVFGMTRMGKSRLLSLIALELAALGERVVVIDFFGEYGPLSVHGFRVTRPPDPLSGLTPMEAADLVAEASALTFGREGELTPIVYSVVYRACEACYARGELSVENVVRELQEMRRRLMPDEKAACDAALRRLRGLLVEYGPTLPESGSVVIDLSGYPDIAKVACANAVLRSLLLRPTGRVTVIVDEAHRLARASDDRVAGPLVQLLSEGLGMGVRVVLADQSAGRIAQSALAQCRMLVLFGHGVAERPYLARILGEELAREVLSLKPREVVVLWEGSPSRGYVMEAPRLEAKKAGARIVSLEEVAREVAAKYSVDWRTLLSLYRAGLCEKVERPKGDYGLLVRRDKLTRLGKALLELCRKTSTHH